MKRIHLIILLFALFGSQALTAQVTLKEGNKSDYELSPVQQIIDSNVPQQEKKLLEKKKPSPTAPAIIPVGPPRPLTNYPSRISNLGKDQSDNRGFKSVDGYDVRFEIPEVARNSDTPGCGTPIPVIDGDQVRLPGCPAVVPCDNPANRDASIPLPSDPIKFMKLRWTVVRNAAGTPASNIDQARVDNLMSELNADYAAYRIQFCSDPANFVSSGTYYSLNAGTEDAGLKSTFGANFTNEINIYVVDDISNPNAGGYARFPYDPFGGTNGNGGVVMGRTNSSLGTHTLAHELGHTFGLHHTFHGVDEVAICSNCYENVGAASGAPAIGDTDGDLCSDTNPHPTNAYNCFDPAGSNACDAFPWNNTPVNNHMSYSFCTTTFTPQQAGRMHCMIDTYVSSWVNYGGATCGALPPVPDFTGTPQIWQAPADVNFTDLSVPASTITAWVWDFDVANLGGVTPATFNGQFPPAVNYANPGNYTVSLTVTNVNGSQAETKVNYIQLSAPAGECDTLDTQWNTPAPAPSTYNFAANDYLSGVPAPTLNGGGAVPLGMYEVYNTPTPGTTTVGAVRVALSSLLDADDDMDFQVVIYEDLAGLPDIGSGPIAFAGPYSPTTLGVPAGGFFAEYWIPFLNAPTITTGLFHVGIEIFPGDANDRLLLITSADPQGQGAGRNNVLCNNFGLINYNTFVGVNFDLHLVPMLGGYNPQPVIDGYFEDVRCDTTFVILADTAYYSDPVSWEFEFGDGQTYNSTTDPQLLLKTYLTAGPDIVTVTAINACGRIGQSAWIIPYNFLVTPDAEFDKDLPNASCMGAPGITFTSSTLSMADYQWDFGDGNSANSGVNPSVTHIYPNAGTYNVTLTTTGGGYLPASTIFSEDFEGGIPGGFALFNVDANPNTQYPPFSAAAWIAADFDGDGSTEAISTSWYNPAATSNDWMITPAIALNANSSLYWDAEASDVNFPDGYEVRISTTTQTVAGCLANPPLLTVAAENAVRTSRNVNLAAAGYASQTVYIAFRNNSNDQNLLYIDNILVGTTSVGCSNIEQKLPYVQTIDCTIIPPTAYFTVDVSSGCQGVPLQFTDESTGPDPATSWLWDFGDGSFTTVQDPIHTYPFAGVYEVTFIAYNDGGSDTARVFIDVSSCSVLPIELLYFEGKNKGTFNHLTWATSSEIASDHFDLYRINESESTKIATLESAHNSSQVIMYEWKDHSPPLGINYYRLDQYDQDGSLSFTKVIAIGNYGQDGTSNIQLSPNPSNDRVNVIVNPDVYQYFEVFNPIGQYMMRQKVDDLSGQSIDVSSWPKGAYLFNFVGNRVTETRTLIVY